MKAAVIYGEIAQARDYSANSDDDHQIIGDQKVEQVTVVYVAAT